MLAADATLPLAGDMDLVVSSLTKHVGGGLKRAREKTLQQQEAHVRLQHERGLSLDRP